MRIIYDLLRSMGLTSKYRGYYFLADAVDYVSYFYEDQIKVTRELYPYLVGKYDTTPVNVESTIRTAINVCWKNNSKRMSEITGYNLVYKPTNSEFIDILAYYILYIKPYKGVKKAKVKKKRALEKASYLRVEK